MRRLLVQVGLLGLSILPVLGNASANDTQYPLIRNVSPDTTVIEYSPTHAVEQLHGQAAKNHLASLLARRPHVFDHALERLKERGYRKQTDVVFVERTLRAVNGHFVKTPEYLLTQTSGESNADGEILFWSSDGPGSTWQGTIYLEVYGQGWQTWAGQIDTGTTDYPWIWNEFTGGADCTVGCGPDYQSMPVPEPGDLNHPKFLKVSQSHVRLWQLAAFNMYDWADCWRVGVVGGCAGAAVSCLGTTAGWPACWAARCVGAEVTAGIVCAMR